MPTGTGSCFLAVLVLFSVLLISTPSSAFLASTSTSSIHLAAATHTTTSSENKPTTMTAATASSSSSSSITTTSMPSIELILCRHGETCHNNEGRCQGMEDVSRLTDLGQSQAQELGRAIAEEGARIDRIFISPLARARHTFDQMEGQWRLLGFKDYPRCAPTFLPDIQEICLYEWQGHLRKDLQARYPEQYDNWQNKPAVFQVGDRFPVIELWARAKKAWHQILTQSQPGERVLVVAHSGINQALCFSALGQSEEMYRRLNFPNCGALHLRLPVLGSEEEVHKMVHAGRGFTLPVMTAVGDGEGNVNGNNGGGAKFYRRVHPPEWEPEVHRPAVVQKENEKEKETVGKA